MKIQDIMSTPAITCGISDDLNTAARLMWEHDCGALPVVDKEGIVVGIITDRDICMAAYTQGGPLRTIGVRDSMAKQVFTCRAGDALDVVEKLMSEKQIRRVPVTDVANRPVGILSLSDVARYAASSRKKDGIDRELMRTLAAISEPRPQSFAPAPSLSQRAQPLPPGLI